MLTRFQLLLFLVITSALSSSAQDGDRVFVNSVGMSFVEIPAGTFEMGRSHSYADIVHLTKTYHGVEPFIRAEVPQHKVQLASFQMQTTEVTQGQWEAVMDTRPWESDDLFTKHGENFPATFVSWNEAEEFCKRLSSKEKRSYRLPTEAEWEYACRSGKSTLFHFGDVAADMRDYGWITDYAYQGGEAYAHRVARQKPNAWGLYDMHGNVWEWCSDWYWDEYYKESPIDNPLGPERGDQRVMRGGSWRSYDTNARCAFRGQVPPLESRNDLGFRVVSQLDQKSPIAD